MRLKEILLNCAVIVLGLGILLLGVEISLRVLPNHFTAFGSYVPLVADPDVGFVAKPNATLRAADSCYAVSDIETNAQGFRDDPWSEEDADGAFLGNGVILARQVTTEAVTAQIVKEWTGLDIMNVGVDGHGTVSEIDLYKKYIRPRNPRFIVLFLTDADVVNNACQLMETVNGVKDRPCFVKQDNQITRASSYDAYVAKQKTLITRLHRTLYDHVMVYRLFSSLLNVAPTAIKNDAPAPIVYRTDMTPEMTQGWALTKEALRQLKEETSNDDVQLILVHYPNNMAVSSGVDKNIDPNLPRKKLQLLAQELRIAYVPLTADFNSYRAKYDLKAPYFAFRCDPHWNPVGHYLAAKVITQYLYTHNLTNKRPPKKLLSPTEILGKKNFDAIYGVDGVFMGESNL